MARSFDDATPIYLQIADEVRTQIVTGALTDGDRLTSTTEYATRYRINPATANKAITQLVDEGLVVKRRGIGMFVADGARKRLVAARRATYADDVLGPALDAGASLGLDDDALLASVAAHLSHRRRTGPSGSPDSGSPAIPATPHPLKEQP